MKVLVTGGTGVIGDATITALLQRGHAVRLLSRHAAEDVRRWSQGVSAWPGDVATAATVEGAADGCEAVLHIAGIAEESGEDATFERVNVEGTRHVLAEAERAGVRKFVHVSSLGAERGDSAYHRSKRAAEELVRGFGGQWVVVRPGATYGPGDAHVSRLLKMVRSLPAVPVVGDGEQQFQPLWCEDLAEALAVALERPDVSHVALAVAGRELTSERDLIARMEALTGRHPVLVPVPQLAASFGMKALTAMGLDLPFTEQQLEMLTEGNVIADDTANGLTMLGVRPTPLDAGLRRLMDELPEQLPSEGVGSMQHKRYWADIRGARYDAPALMAMVRDRFSELFPTVVDTRPEPGAPIRITEGETLTLGLPLRGHVQVRAAEVDASRFTLVSLEGHPIAGAARFLSERRGDAVRFEVEVFERAANAVDLLMIRTLGALVQDANWETVVRRTVEASGGAGEVEKESRTLDEQQAGRVHDWLRELMMERKRDEAGV